MLDVREQIQSGLLTIISNVKMSRPEGDVVLPLITYAEVSNVHIGIGQERLEYQVDVRAGTFEECISLMLQVDEVMSGIGMRRTYASPDSVAREGQDLYHKALNYVGKINTFMNVFYGGM